MKLQLLTLAGALAFASSAAAASKSLLISVDAGGKDRVQTPITAVVSLPAAFRERASVELRDPRGKPVPAQLTPLGLLNEGAKAAEGQVLREVHFVVPRMDRGEKHVYKATVTDKAAPAGNGYSWHDTAGDNAELRHEGRPVLRYMYRPLDESTKEARELTYKVFHHLYDPTGTRLVTKGPGGQFTHHRGLFYGFNRVSYGEGKKADVWHSAGDAHQSHQKFLSSEAGPILGRHRVLLNWHGPGKEVFAQEEREMTVYRVPGGQLVQFASRLHSKAGKVRLDGDPQHAGFHFRADNEVAETTKAQTYYLRPDGQGKPGETRNWPMQKEHVNLPWNGMSFVLGGKRYTALYLDRPTNPKEARFSERDYGRFGSYFEYDLEPEKPLVLSYRVWLQEGELAGPQAAAKSADFVAPPSVEVD